MRRPIFLIVMAIAACGPSARNGGDDGDGSGDGGSCQSTCSDDLRAIEDCNGNVITQCTGGTGCDPSTLSCVDACAAANANHQSVGCNYYATDMDVQQQDYCFAAFVANTWTTPAKINVKYMGQMLNVASFARIPTGSGPTLTYAPYDANMGVPPGEVAILFLAGTQGASPNCPATPAVPSSGSSGTKIGNAFEITTDVPVVAYQINPYGGGSVAVTAGSLLLPTSVWDTEYVAVNVSPAGVAGNPSLNIVAKSDGTVVTLTPKVNVSAGTGIPAGTANTPMTITLNAGQHAQITQAAELSGSVISATAPIGFMAGQVCMNMPTNITYCDHGEQMVPPVRALGSRYVGVMYRPRVAAENLTTWRIVGAVDGTLLTWSTSIPGAPTMLNKGDVLQFDTGTPFIVQSQDPDHPFALFTYMSGSSRFGEGYGDPDFVVSVPPEQYMRNYVFFTDPTYPETNLVMIRQRAMDGTFKDVMLDCLGPVTGWQPIAGGDYEFARVDLSTGNFMGVGQCNTGRHEATSAAPFGLWIWGWGTPQTSMFTANVSYGYPGGMNVEPINNVILRTAP